MDSIQLLEEEQPHARRVAKLAGFFGVNAAGNAGILGESPAEAAEIQKIFNALATSPSTSTVLLRRLSGPGTYATASLGRNFYNRTVPIMTTVYKEGWIHSYNYGKKSWVLNWANLDNRSLKLRPTTKDEAIVPSSSIENHSGPLINLENCVVEMVDVTTYKRPYVFVVLQKTGEKTVLAAGSEGECVDWVNCIKVAGRVGKKEEPEVIPVSPPSTPDVGVTRPRTSDAEVAQKEREEKMTIADFEIHRVIGRGKFAKV